MDRIYPPRKNRPNPVVALTSDPVWPQHDWEDWFDIKGGPLARAYHVLEEIDLGPARDSGRGPLLEFNVGSHPGDNTHYVNAKDMLSLSLLQARLVDLKLPIKIVEGE